MNFNNGLIRNANQDEFNAIGQLLVDVYSQLDGFPKQDEQPEYYQLLANVEGFTKKKGAEILVAVSDENKLLGAVIYFGSMLQYGPNGIAANEENTAGFRLLAVDPATRGLGIGKLLTQACIQKAKDQGRRQVIIHSTKAMQTAWDMYERMGFVRSEDLDFMQEKLPVFGFRMKL